MTESINGCSQGPPVGESCRSSTHLPFWTPQECSTYCIFLTLSTWTHIKKNWSCTLIAQAMPVIISSTDECWDRPDRYKLVCEGTLTWIVIVQALGAKDTEIIREPNDSNILNDGVKVLGGTIIINIGEQMKWWDRMVVVSSCQVGSRKFEPGARFIIVKWMSVSGQKCIVERTSMSDVDRSARSENGESARIVKASGVRRAILELEVFFFFFNKNT